MKITCDELLINNQSLNLENKMISEDYKELKGINVRLRDKKDSTAHLIELPTKNIQQIDSILKLWDKFMINTLIDYLKLDSYELTKSIPWVMNESNVLQSVSYLDWALQRNQNLIEVLSKYWKENKKGPEYLKKL